MTDTAFALCAHPCLDVSSPIGDRDTVKVEPLTLVAEQHAVAATIVKGLDVAHDSHELAMDP